MMPAKERILVPTNFTPAAAKAVEHAAALAQERSFSITLLHIINVNPPDSTRWIGPAGGHMAQLHSRALLEMHRLTQSLAARHIESHAVIQEGIPWEEIVEQSRAVDLMVLAREKPRKFRLFSQDTVRRVLASAHCDVMLVPKPDGAPTTAHDKPAAHSPAQKAA
jgi:nucleotide-binding universal stress UspA family protein